MGRWLSQEWARANKKRRQNGGCLLTLIAAPGEGAEIPIDELGAAEEPEDGAGGEVGAERDFGAPFAETGDALDGGDDGANDGGGDESEEDGLPAGEGADHHEEEDIAKAHGLAGDDDFLGGAVDGANILPGVFGEVFFAPEDFEFFHPEFCGDVFPGVGVDGEGVAGDDETI